MADAMDVGLKLLERRRDVRRILGESYATRIAPYREAIRDVAKARGLPLIQAAMLIAKGDTDLGASYTLAALADVLEASDAR